MSYIFEALKKLEQGRQREKVSRLLMITGDFTPERRRWPFWTFSVIAALLLLNAMVMLWWVHPWSPHEQPPAPPQTASPAPAPAANAKADEGVAAPPVLNKLKSKEASQSQAAAMPPSPPAEVKTPQVSEASPGRSKVTIIEPKTGTESRAPPNRIFDLKELPPAIKSSLPELKISAHYYTDEPQARFTRINEYNLREGQALTEGIKLEEITPEGVVLSYKGYRFQVGLK